MQIIESGYRNDGRVYSRHNVRVRGRGSSIESATCDTPEPDKWRIVIEPNAKPRLEKHLGSLKHMKGRIMIYETYDEAKEEFDAL